MCWGIEALSGDGSTTISFRLYSSNMPDLAATVPCAGLHNVL